MKLDSKYFDSIRITSRKAARAESKRPELPLCQWKGCDATGNHRAPRGRGYDGEFYVFCVDHARQFNASYNYFDGMNDEDVARFIKDSVTGHRPTWKAGANAWAHGTHGNSKGATADSNGRTFSSARAKAAKEAAKKPKRQVKPLERKSLATLGLEAQAEREQIKARFKELVKRHHPDANGGNKASEDRLREIIQAYNYLKQAGLV